MAAVTAHSQVLGKVVDGSFDGLTGDVFADIARQRPHVGCMGRVVVQPRPFLRRKMVHFDGVGLHRQHVGVAGEGLNRRPASAATYLPEVLG